MSSYTRYPALAEQLPLPEKENLERFCLLNRLGNFAAAEDCWTRDLQRHTTSFVHTVSRIDGVLRQSRYRDAENLLQEYLGREGLKHEAEQEDVLRLIEVYLGVFIHGRLRAAVSVVRANLQRVSRAVLPECNDYQIHAVELCLHVLKFALSLSNYVTRADTIFPNAEKGVPAESWSGYREWIIRLAQQGHVWEAINATKILASAQPSTWSVETYEDLLKVLPLPATDPLINLSHCTLLVALSRRLIHVEALERAETTLKECCKLRDRLEQEELKQPLLRLSLEAKMTKLEATVKRLDADRKIEKWYEIAMTAHKQLEWGIESEMLDQCMQVCATEGRYEDLYRFYNEHQVINRDYEGDYSTALISCCNLWRSGDTQHYAEILRYIDEHCARFPVSRFLSDGDHGDLKGWDIPVSIARLSEVRNLIYTSLHDTTRANSSNNLALKARQYVPKRSMVDAYEQEWFDHSTGKSYTTFQVLINRIRSRYSQLNDSDKSDWFRYRDLNSLELQSIVLCSPINLDQFTARMISLRSWFESDDSLDSDSSYSLIARLHLDSMKHTKSHSNDVNIIKTLTQKLEDFVQSIPQSSSEISKLYQANVLLAWQEIFDIHLKFGAKSTSQLQELRLQYLDLIGKYARSYHANRLTLIACLHGRLAEIDLRLANSTESLTAAMSQLSTALNIYDDYRVTLSVVGGLPALQLKASVRDGIVGEQEILHQAVSVLVCKSLYTPATKTIVTDIPKGQIANYIWDLVQRTKNRALSDSMSFSFSISVHDRAAIERNDQSKARFQNWQAATQALAQALAMQPTETAAIQKARTQLHAYEKAMTEDPICERVLALSKGAPPSLTDFNQLFPAGSPRIILVDWFTAHVPASNNKLFMVTSQVSPEVQDPQIHELQLGIARHVFEWIAKFIVGPDAAENRKSPDAFEGLKLLAGLVQPLAHASQPDDILVFCPTTQHFLHQVPLHAIPLRSADPQVGQSPGIHNHLLMLRNRIIYTFSQSLLRMNMISRQNIFPQSSFHSTILSPLSDHSVNIARSTSQFASFFRDEHKTTLLESSGVTKSASLTLLPKASLLTFVGHVHTRQIPVESHLLLYRSSPLAGCEQEDAENILSGQDIINESRLQDGAHVILLACGSGIVQAQFQNEVLGLGPALLYAGAGSVVATLWEIEPDTACDWLKAFQQEWRKRERHLRNTTGKEGQDMIDMADLCRRATKVLFEMDTEHNLDSWAPFIYSGYWMFHKAALKLDGAISIR